MSRKDAHNAKRAERFAERGISLLDIKYAEATFIGEAEVWCALCDHPIKYLFRLDFHKPEGRVEFAPVGSKCITDWMEALPASAERDKVLATIKEIEREIARARREAAEAKKRLESMPPDARALWTRYKACPVAKDNATLADIAERLERYGDFASYGQKKYFEDLLKRAERKAQGLPEEEERVFSAEDQALMQRYLACGDMAKTETALVDIGTKLAKFKGFASNTQREYFISMLKKVERKIEAEAEAEEEAEREAIESEQYSEPQEFNIADAIATPPAAPKVENKPVMPAPPPAPKVENKPIMAPEPPPAPKIENPTPPTHEQEKVIAKLAKPEQVLIRRYFASSKAQKDKFLQETVEKVLEFWGFATDQAMMDFEKRLKELES